MHNSYNTQAEYMKGVKGKLNAHKKEALTGAFGVYTPAFESSYKLNDCLTQFANHPEMNPGHVTE